MKRIIQTALFLSLFNSPLFAATLGTSFLYQGRLTSGASAATGVYDLKFTVYDSLTLGSVRGGPITNAAVAVSNGLFTVGLDFGSIFTGSALWLETSVRTNGNGAFTLLSPRQPLSAAPYAQYAPGAGTANTASAVVAGGVTSAMLADGAVTPVKIAAGSISFTNVDDGGSSAYEGFGVTARAMATTEPLPFSSLSVVASNTGTGMSFTLDGAAFGTTLGFVGTEYISEAYEHVVEVLAGVGALNPDTVNGREGRLTFTRGSSSSSYAGLVTGCAVSSYDGRLALYTFRLEPPLCYLDMSTDYRVYQHTNVPDLVAGLSSALASTTPARSLSGSYSTRESLTQYGETALNFVTRLMEDEGLFYYFQQGASVPTLVLADSSGGFPVYGELSYYGDNATNAPLGQEFVRTFQRSTRRTTRQVTIREYDFEKPTLTLEANRDGGAGRGEDYEFGSPWKTATELERQAQHRAERYQLERVMRSGTGTAAGLHAGYTLDLVDVAEAGVGGAYLITSVQHAGFRRAAHGITNYLYGNRFEVIPAGTQFRPPWKAKRPAAQPCPAVVTGPSGEEISVDKYGRVKVQLAWDRIGLKDENSSAWVRVASPWAGDGHGLLFLPRIGDEVLVGFVQGDPDKPVVLSSFYNAKNTVPYQLPGGQATSTIKTRSSKAGTGGNEIQFRDNTGSELLGMTAQKDFNLQVKNHTVISNGVDLKLTVRHDLTVGCDNDFNITAARGIGINTGNDPAFGLKVNGAVAATGFQGSGAGLTNIAADSLTGSLPDGRLSSNVALRSGGNVFLGAQTIAGGPLRMSDQGIFFRGGSDVNHGLGWASTGSFAGVNPDGPVLWGCSGGSLGALCGVPFLALTWNSQGNVAIDPGGTNTGALLPGLTFGTAAREGIASKRSAGGNQNGLDFYTGGTNRMSVTSVGNVGVGTTSPTRRLQVVDTDGNSGSVQIGAAAANASPKLINFGDGDYVHVGETGSDDQLELKGTVVSVVAAYVGIGNTSPTNKLMVGNARCDGLSWINASDRDAKEHFAPVESREVLAKVAALPISRWSYKESDGSTHLGPVAQDFHQAFGLGVDDKSIATVDADGVALAAIQGLNQVVKEKEAEIRELRARLERLERLAGVAGASAGQALAPIPRQGAGSR